MKTLPAATHPPEIRGYQDGPVRLTRDTLEQLSYCDRPPQDYVGKLNVQGLTPPGHGYAMPGFCSACLLRPRPPVPFTAPRCPECAGWGQRISWHIENGSRLILWCMVRLGGGKQAPVYRPIVIVDTPEQEWLPLHWRSSMAAYLWRWPDSASSAFYGRWATCRTGEDVAAREMAAAKIRRFLSQDGLEPEDVLVLEHTLYMLYPWPLETHNDRR